MYKKHFQVLKVISVRKHFDNIDKKPFERKDLIKQTDGLYIEAFKHVSQIYCDNREKLHTLEVHTRIIWTNTTFVLKRVLTFLGPRACDTKRHEENNYQILRA